MIPSFVARARSAWKGPFFVGFPNLRDCIERNIPIFTRARACTVLPSFVGARFNVHNGRAFIPVHVTPEMVGHKLGEFAPTRRAGKKPAAPERRPPNSPSKGKVSQTGRK